MSDDDAGAAPDTTRRTAAPLAAAFAALIGLTVAELIVAGTAAGRAARITALAGLLIAKVALVISFVMQARKDRGASAGVVVAIAFAAAAAVVLMLETISRVVAR